MLQLLEDAASVAPRLFVKQGLAVGELCASCDAALAMTAARILGSAGRSIMEAKADGEMHYGEYALGVSVFGWACHAWDGRLLSGGHEPGLILDLMWRRRGRISHRGAADVPAGNVRARLSSGRKGGCARDCGPVRQNNSQGEKVPLSGTSGSQPSCTRIHVTEYACAAPVFICVFDCRCT